MEHTATKPDKVNISITKNFRNQNTKINRTQQPINILIMSYRNSKVEFCYTAHHGKISRDHIFKVYSLLIIKLA